MIRSHSPAFRRELKFIVECNACAGKGIRLGIFHYLECEHCLGSGWVCGHTLQTLSLSDVVPVLNARLKDALTEIARARHVIGGAQGQYEQNNRRGAGGSNYTGD
ncbi:hypothetical protein OH720_18500 [Pseudomonas sp. WJP1]|uniref:hypothetical protein n=1 Tax=Pseudomonas sp. WJP1 TaxID=2986947 RepID=UPI00234B1F74|nr:hypothetical protein [Pseudomonas sp. WJP1]WCM49001.1 hypothetical protein OH720_18500 [Pseudomonas sp. WJP1]